VASILLLNNVSPAEIGRMKATLLLEKQHRKVESLLKKLQTEKRDPEIVLGELANHLAAHMAIEQRIFYPQARHIRPDRIAESLEEHAMAELELKRLLATSPNSTVFQARVATLKELVAHHVREEEDELFPSVARDMDEATLLSLGEQMEQSFAEDLQRGFDALLAKGLTSASADEASDPALPAYDGPDSVAVSG
jgi:hemerythrin superfamily protein